MDYLKLFQTHEEYEAFVSGGTMMKPNVSHCIQENDVHYNPIIPPQPLIAIYNVEDATNPTQLYYYEIMGASLFKKIEVDGVEVSISDLDTASGAYLLSVGEHTVRYTLKDPTTISRNTFRECEFASVTLDNTVTTIEGYAFGFCDNLETINIPDSITTIENYSFADCNNHSLDSDIAAIIYSFNNKAFKWEK